MAPRIYVDANIFTTAFESSGPDQHRAWRVLAAADQGVVEPPTSELSLAEMLSKASDQKPELAERYETMIGGRAGLVVVPVSRQVLIEAARWRRGTSSLKLPDAIHLASPDVSACDAILSSDRRLRSAARLTALGLDGLDSILGPST